MVLFLIGFAREFRTERLNLLAGDVYLRGGMLLFIVTGLLCALSSLFFSAADARIAISDFSFFAIPVMSYCIIRYSRRSGSFEKYLFCAVLAKCLFATYLYWSSAQHVFSITDESLYKPIMDSTKNMFQALVLAPIFFIDFRQRITSTLWCAVAAIGLFQIVVYASRTNMLLLAVAYGFIFLLTLKGHAFLKPLSYLQKVAVCVIIPMLLSLGSFHYSNPRALSFAQWKIGSTIPSSQDKLVEDLGIATSSNIRMLEFVNIWGDLTANNRRIFGKGLGSFFNDDEEPYFHAFTYPESWMAGEGCYKSHESVSFLLLKGGVIGLVAYLSGLAMVFLRGLFLCLRASNNYRQSVTMLCLSMLPLLAYKSHNSKMQVFLGVVFALLHLNAIQKGRDEK